MGDANYKPYKRIEEILTEIRAYDTANRLEKDYQERIINFIVNNKDNPGTNNPEGHLTASAWIVNSAGNKVLLHNHIVFNKWIQLGGHLEDDELISDAALREAREESGLRTLSLLKDDIFDIDVHKIPENEKHKEHYHYDIRYLMEAEEEEEISRSKESREIDWIKLEKVKEYAEEEAILRMVRKTEQVLGNTEGKIEGK